METTTTQAPPVRQKTGRLYFWIGLVLPFAGIAAYILQFQARVLKMPWYLPAFGTLGVVFIVLALLRKRNIWRIGGLILTSLLAFVQWFVVAGGLRLPAYSGPVVAGQAIPSFVATFSDGKPFTPESLRGDKNTALVFFRGRS